MTADRLLVDLVGLLLVAFIVWFFWLGKAKRVRAALVSGGRQEQTVLVKGGYTPDVIVVEAGRPVRLSFVRQEAASCSDTVLFPAFQKSAHLPEGETVPVEFVPSEPGEYDFGCPMGMFRGKLVVE
jgi:plastocyanin domain-containing protein